MEVLHPTQQLNHQGLHLPWERNEITHMLPLPQEFPTPLQKGPGTQGCMYNPQQLHFRGKLIPGTVPAQGGCELPMITHYS